MKQLKLWIVAVLTTLMLFSLGMTAFASVETSTGNVTQEDVSNRYESGVIRRAIRVENDSFTLTYQNDCGNAQKAFTMGFFNSPTVSLTAGNGSATENGLDIYVKGESFDIYNNKGWSELNQVFDAADGSAQAAGWLVSAYSVNKKTHLTVSKDAEDNIVFSVYSENGNSYLQEGVTFTSGNFKNGNALKFSDLVDENGYTYLAVACQVVYPITLYETVTKVNGISFTYENGSPVDVAKLSISKGFDSAGKEVLLGESQIFNGGYSFVAPEIAELEFTDGTVTVRASVGENVVLPFVNYKFTRSQLGGVGSLENSSKRWSIGDTEFGKMLAGENGVRFELAIQKTDTTQGMFSIVIGPTTYVQAPGQTNVPDNFKKGMFNLFMTFAGNELTYSFYDSSWKQYMGDNPIATFVTNETFYLTVEVKKVEEIWGVYLNGTKIAGSKNDLNLDFNELIGDTFLDASGRTNIAIVGHNASTASAYLTGTQIDVSADISSEYTSESFYANVTKGYDSAENPIDVFRSSATSEGLQFTVIDPSALKTVDIETYGGVVSNVNADYKNLSFADQIVLGAREEQYEKKITVTDSVGTPLSGATIAILENEQDVSSFYEIASEGSMFTVKGVNRDITVRVDYTDPSAGQASKTVMIAKETASTTVELETFPYVFTSEVDRTLVYNGKDKFDSFSSERIFAENGLAFSYELDTAAIGSGLQLYFTNGKPLSFQKPEEGSATFQNSIGSFDCGEFDGVRLIICYANESTKFVQIDVQEIRNGAGTEMKGSMLGAAGVANLSVLSTGKHTISLVGNNLMIDGKTLYTFTEALWLDEDGMTFASAFASRNYCTSVLTSTLKLYTDVIRVENATVTGISENQAGYLSLIGYDAARNTYTLDSFTLDIEGKSYTVKGINIGYKIVEVEATTPGGVKATFGLTSETVAFAAGNTLTVTTNLPLAKDEVKIFTDGKDVTEGISFKVTGTDILISGLSDTTVTIVINKTNYVEWRQDFSVAATDVSGTATLVRDTYQVKLKILSGNLSVENLEDSLKVYAVTDLITPLPNVTIVYENDVYVISGIECGVSVRIVFEKDGYVSDSVDATDAGVFTMNIKEIFDVWFTVTANGNICDDLDAVSVAGMNEGAELRFSDAENRFEISGLTEEVKVTVSLAGFEKQAFVLRKESASKEIVLVALDRSELNSALVNARELLENTKISADGTDIEKTESWVTQADADMLRLAIAAAEADFETNADIAEALAALEEEISAFESAVSLGTKSEEPQKGSGCSGCQSSAASLAVLALLALAGATIRFK